MSESTAQDLEIALGKGTAWRPQDRWRTRPDRYKRTLPWSDGNDFHRWSAIRGPATDSEDLNYESRHSQRGYLASTQQRMGPQIVLERSYLTERDIAPVVPTKPDCCSIRNCQTGPQTVAFVLLIKELLSDCCMLEDHCRLHGPNSDLSLLSDIHSNGQIAHHRSDERPRPAFDIAHPARVAIVTNVFCSYLTAAASHAPRSRRSIPIKPGVHGRRPTEAFHNPLGPGVRSEEHTSELQSLR